MPTSKGHAAKTGQDHHVGFNEALQDALDKMDQEFPKGTKHNVEVTLQLLDVEVKSPGNVGFYQVTVTTS